MLKKTYNILTEIIISCKKRNGGLLSNLTVKLGFFMILLRQSFVLLISVSSNNLDSDGVAISMVTYALKFQR